MTVRIADLMNESGVRFGTSGARGLVTAMTDRVCYAYTRGFLQMLLERGEVQAPLRAAIGGDRRSSTPRIMAAAARAALDLGFEVVYAGLVPSPAIALFGLRETIPTIMVTGSHIPDDRNGIKFNKPSGEILKSDESELLAQAIEMPDLFDRNGSLRVDKVVIFPAPLREIETEYVRRWTSAVKANALAGKKIVVFGHSAVGRDILVDVYRTLGAEVVSSNWSDKFIPVDTEAIRPEDVDTAREIARKYEPFSIVSTDGDSDRPLISDENGQWLRGDVIGVLAAQWLGADAVVTPVSSNTVVERVALFKTVMRTKIGSPYVISAMQDAVNQGYRRVVGYEANGGFLTATITSMPGGPSLTPLPTRDPIIVQLCVLLTAIDAGLSVSELMARLPARYTASDRLENFPVAISQRRLGELSQLGIVSANAMLCPLIGQIAQIDTTDGLRAFGQSGEIIHLRSSGNAPELRCYAEADTAARAQQLIQQTLALCSEWKVNRASA
jgi:phosphomannomutase